MPLFECSECHVVDNTACTNFWIRRLEGESQLCSQCDPEIAEWHGMFPRTPITDFAEKDGVEFPVKEP